MTDIRKVTGRSRSIRWWLSVRVGGLDRVAAAVLALLTLPVVVVLGVAVRLSDGGPAFVRVERMGRDFKPFGMWKVRSMRAERPDGSASGVALTAADDARVTRLGAHIRQYHLDELPQLWNVVRGEMLLLGPRPEAPEYVRLDDPRWRRVLRVPPGIAGPTQMIVGTWERRIITDDPSGGAYQERVVPAKLEIDGWYLDASSLWLDLLTVVALVKRFLPHSHASRMKRRAARALPDVVGPILAEEAVPVRRGQLRRSA
jgi:lipopolysaccharide/colanic/teichoic acid biosynthesis glycosyltransferase